MSRRPESSLILSRHLAGNFIDCCQLGETRGKVELRLMLHDSLQVARHNMSCAVHTKYLTIPANEGPTCA